MKRILCQKLPTSHESVIVPESEARHAIQVLRLRNGDEVEALDGKGRAAIAALSIRGEEVRLSFVRDSASESNSNSVLPIVLEAAVLKGDAMEWVVEKCVELGVQRLVPLLTAHTVVQMNNKPPEAFQERWQKIADQALKQCGRLERMEVALPIKIEIHLAQKSVGTRLWCDEKALQAPFIGSAVQEIAAPAWTLLIGPEGGWSEEERTLLSRQEGIQPVQLGPSILRAETASLFAVSLVSGLLRTLLNR